MNEEFELEKVSLHNTEQIADIWGNPVVKLLYSTLGLATPLMAGIDATANYFFKENQRKKQEKLCEMIFNDYTITKEETQDITFIMEFARVLDVVNRLAANEKIQYIASLFKESYRGFQSHSTCSEFEEYLQRLDSISLREIDLLFLLVKIEDRIDFNHKRSAEDIYKIWDIFKKEAQENFNLEEEMVVSIMSGLAMTGFCREARFMFPSDEMIETPCYTTQYFRKFLDLIKKGNLKSMN